MKSNAHQKQVTQTTGQRINASRSTLFLVSIAFLLLSIILLSVALAVQRSTQKPLIVPPIGFSVNSPVTMGSVEMTVAKVAFSDGQPGFNAPANMHYATIDITVKNLVDHPLDILPSSDTYLKDSTGVVSYMTPYNLKQPFRAGRLLPGESISGQISFIVAKSHPAKLYVDSIWSGGVVPFKVQ